MYSKHIKKLSILLIQSIVLFIGIFAISYSNFDLRKKAAEVIEYKSLFTSNDLAGDVIALFGQPDVGESGRDTVTAGGLYHSAGVVVDRSVRPNRMYIADTGNNRILGYKSLGNCSNNPVNDCTNDLDCGSTVQQSYEYSTRLDQYPLYCNTQTDNCWDDEYIQYLSSDLEYSKAYLLRPEGMAQFNILLPVNQQMRLIFGYLDGNNSHGDGFSVLVKINNQEVWSADSNNPPDHMKLEKVSVDLSSYVGQTIIIDFITKAKENNWGDEPMIVDPMIVPNNSCVVNTEKKADIVIGQKDFFHSACNRNNNTGFLGLATKESLCLLPYPAIGNTAEEWHRVNFDVDIEGNLYVPDIYNNRVLIYHKPFEKNKTSDISPDQILGQDNYAETGVNKGNGLSDKDASTLFLGLDRRWAEKSAAHGVSVDKDGNVWIADTLNGRVLRFSKLSDDSVSTTASLIVGQKDAFSSDLSNCKLAYDIALNLQRLCKPLLAKVHPVTGDLYVLDETEARDLENRILWSETKILVYKNSVLNSGNTPTADHIITVQQSSPFDKWPGWPIEYFTQLTSFEFNTINLPEYENGVLWVTEHEAKRILLIDENGNIIRVINGPKEMTTNYNNSDGLKYRRGGEEFMCRHTGTLYGELCGTWPGGSFGVDNANNIYMSSEWRNGIIRYSLPFHVDTSGLPSFPIPNGALYRYWKPNTISGSGYTEIGGLAVFQNQLMIKDDNRYLVWNDYLNKGIGSKSDFIVMQKNEFERKDTVIARDTFHAIDDLSRLWTFTDSGKLLVFQLPMVTESQPIAQDILLYWKDNQDAQVDYRGERGIAFDKINKALYISDYKNSRILRIGNYKDLSNKLVVDMVIGQPGHAYTKCNHDQEEGWAAPGSAKANGICGATDIEFDHYGNLYIVENSYEGHGNIRISVWMNEDILSGVSSGQLYPNIYAKKVFTQESLTSRAISYSNYTDRPSSPVSLAFNSKNEMVIANDGSYLGHGFNALDRATHILWFYHNSLAKDTSGNYVMNQPADAYIEVPMGAPAEIKFDDSDNLIIQDGSWYRTWVINLDANPSWLTYLDPNYTPVPTQILSNTPIPPTATPIPFSCPIGKPLFSSGNANCDDSINLLDFSIWLNAIRGHDVLPYSADFDQKDGVNILDFQILLNTLRG